MEEAVRTSLLSVVFSIQAREREGEKGKARVASLCKLSFPGLGGGGSMGWLWGWAGEFLRHGEATCSVRVWARENSS